MTCESTHELLGVVLEHTKCSEYINQEQDLSKVTPYPQGSLNDQGLRARDIGIGSRRGDWSHCPRSQGRILSINTAVRRFVRQHRQKMSVSFLVRQMRVCRETANPGEILHS